MIRVFNTVAIIMLVFLFQCGEEGEVNSLNSVNKKEGLELIQLNDNLARGIRANCCNDHFPSEGTNNPEDTACATINWCGSGDVNISCLDCAMLWSEYNLYKGSRLLYKACGESIPIFPRAPSWASAAVDGDNPEIEWGFVYSHEYSVQRKIGSGSWSDLTTLDNCLTGHESCGDSYYIDTSIDLDTISVTYDYRVKSVVYTFTSVPSPTVTFGGTPNVVISGPTSLTTLQTGVFTANVTAGVPDYRYEWWKYQYCNEAKAESDGTRAIPCGSWVKQGGTTNSLSKGGAVPGFMLKVIVTDRASEVGIDYHYVTVSLP